MKIDFEFQTPYGKFRDAITLPDNHNFTEDDIEKMKEQRRDNWIAVVTAPSPSEPENNEEEIIDINSATEE